MRYFIQFFAVLLSLIALGCGPKPPSHTDGICHITARAKPHAHAPESSGPEARPQRNPLLCSSPVGGCPDRPANPQQTETGNGAAAHIMWCYDNLDIRGESHCGHSFDVCEDLKKIRAMAYAVHSLPFTPTACERYEGPFCSLHIDKGDPERHAYYQCSKSEVFCRFRSYVLREDSRVILKRECAAQ